MKYSILFDQLQSTVATTADESRNMKFKSVNDDMDEVRKIMLVSHRHGQLARGRWALTTSNEFYESEPGITPHARGGSLNLDLRDIAFRQ